MCVRTVVHVYAEMPLPTTAASKTNSQHARDVWLSREKQGRVGERESQRRMKWEQRLQCYRLSQSQRSAFVIFSEQDNKTRHLMQFSSN